MRLRLDLRSEESCTASNDSANMPYEPLIWGKGVDAEGRFATVYFWGLLME